MVQILSEQSSQMQNLYTPLPMMPHFVFCLIATVIYLAQYYRKGHIHYLLVMAAIDLTFVTQINTSDIVINCLFWGEIVILAAAAVLSFRISRKKKKEEKAQKQEAENAIEEDKAK